MAKTIINQKWEVTDIGTGQKPRRTLKPQSFEVSQKFKFETAEEIDDHEIEDRYSSGFAFDDNRNAEQRDNRITYKPSELSKVNTRTTRPKM